MDETKTLEDLARFPVREDGLDSLETRKFFFRLKEAVWECEKDNLTYIIFYHREGRFWQTGDNSMLIYYNLVVKQAGLKKVIIRRDNDYNKRKWKYGYITINRIDQVMKNLDFFGYRLEVDTEEVKAFRVPAEITQEIMFTWQHSERDKEKRFQMLVVPKNQYPKILSTAAVLHREIVNKVANLPPARQRYYGDKGAELAGWISLNSVAMANGRIDKSAFAEKSLSKLDELTDWLAYVKKFELFSMDASLRLLEEINQLKDLLRQLA